MTVVLGLFSTVLFIKSDSVITQYPWVFLQKIACTCHGLFTLYIECMLIYPVPICITVFKASCSPIDEILTEDFHQIAQPTEFSAERVLMSLKSHQKSFQQAISELTKAREELRTEKDQILIHIDRLQEEQVSDNCSRI